jgi:processive 1,2-diacylglycerol beta-glucosyltransferase
MKILVTHASAGAGHMKAAEAVYDGIKKYTDHDVTFIDALDYTSPFFKKMYKGTYFFMISKAPAIWAFSFAMIDFPWIQPFVRFVRRIYNYLNGQKLHKFLIEEQFDYIISAHFMPNEVSCALKRAGKIKSKVITTITDYDVHKIWLAEGLDVLAVACDWTKEKLKRVGIDEQKIIVTGIPTNEKFSQQQDKVQLKERLGIKQDMFNVLIATGSFGIGPIEEIIRTLKGFQVIVVCGHSKTLYESLTKKSYENVRIFGLVDNMHELMAVSDVMVTKPGGLSISEALVSQLPMIFFSAIPGQETNNIKVLKEYGIGISGCGIDEIGKELEKFKNSNDEFLAALKKTQELARPSAVRDIVALLK